MRPARPEFVPDADVTRAEMEEVQRAVADAATVADDLSVDTGAVGAASGPVVAGVDQAFLDDRAVSAVVCWRGGSVVERTHAVSPLELPYVPGLLAFREGGPALDAFASLDVDPDLALVDGSGRIHFRRAGLATHLGVALDLPTVGVAKSLLCGTPRESVEGRPAGWRTPVEVRPDDDVDAPVGTTLGYAYQSRQYDGTPRINPLYVSPGHRVGPETAAEVVAACCRGYKLPEPVRLADAHADEAKAAVETGGR